MRYGISFNVNVGYMRYVGMVMTSVVLRNARKEIGFRPVCAEIAETERRMQSYSNGRI